MLRSALGEHRAIVNTLLAEGTPGLSSFLYLVLDCERMLLAVIVQNNQLPAVDREITRHLTPRYKALPLRLTLVLSPGGTGRG